MNERAADGGIAELKRRRMDPKTGGQEMARRELPRYPQSTFVGT